MLTKIREKTKGTFAWGILIVICVPFALMGLNNYTDNVKEAGLVVVGETEFSQYDVNQAYEQFKQQYAEMQVPEAILKQQAIEKLISDELLLQHVVSEKLSISDTAVREFIASLQYFQEDGKFNKKQYEAVLGRQGMSTAQFVNRVRKALLMEQFQKAVTESSFVPKQELAQFFKIQNQTRSIEYSTVKVNAIKKQPSQEDIDAYYAAHTSEYQTEEQASIEYIQLTLSDLMQSVTPSDEQVTAYYEENKVLFSKKERRKISHILFAKTKETTLEQALEKAKAAKSRLAKEEFASLAKELSDDSLTAKVGGDLGLFEVGVMEANFEKVAAELVLGEISEPVESAFGYHIITVTELVPAVTKPLEEVKIQVKEAVQRAEAETSFYELGESLTELSFENSDNLQVVAEMLDLPLKTSKLFTRQSGEGIAEEGKIRSMAFSKSVLEGNNSEPVELGDDSLVIVRLLKHLPAETKSLATVKASIELAIQAKQAKELAQENAEKIKQKLLAGSTFKDAVKAQKLTVQALNNVARNNSDLTWQLNQAVFKAAKPIAGESTIFIVASAEGEQTVVKLTSVNEGSSKGEAEKEKLAAMNISNALGKADYAAVIDGMRVNTAVSINQ
ncbi:MAG: SurA N-terminal domain-containing protein [Methyloprofundus sp.]|nr:SurA N-terminal domain-containing protein [Methyloprofundus sp.]